MSRPGRVTEIDEGGVCATVDVNGRTQRMTLAVLVSQGVAVGPGDWLLVTAGIPVERVDSAEAEQLIHLWSEIEGGPL